MSSNNTNKLSPQELRRPVISSHLRSNNTNKLSPQELCNLNHFTGYSSNNTNKLSPQELPYARRAKETVQIIQINLVLKNSKLH